MDENLELRIRERAYEIWENEGRPEGREDEHWQQARMEYSEAREEAPARNAGDPGARDPMPPTTSAAAGAGEQPMSGAAPAAGSAGQAGQLGPITDGNTGGTGTGKAGNGRAGGGAKAG
jgi:hypothetical protein